LKSTIRLAFSDVISKLKRVAVSAFVYAVRSGGVSVAAPQLIITAGYLFVYGLGLVAVGPANLRYPQQVLLALLLGLLGVLGGTLMGWAHFGWVHFSLPPARPAVRHEFGLSVAALILASIGLLSLTLYIMRIGDVPLLMEGAEQSRVEAALRGGAPLRVAGLLALPGSWLVVAHAAATCQRRWAVVAAVLLLLTGGGWLATASRAPVILLFEVSLLVIIYIRGWERVTARGFGALVGAVLAAVVFAGAVGAVRLASSSTSESGGLREANEPSLGRLMVLARIAIEGYARVPIQNLEYTMDAVPDRIGWRLGYTYLQPLLTALPGRQTTFDLDLKAALGQAFQGGGTVPGLLGESYANFGPLGWLLVPGALAFILQGAFALARRLNSSAGWTLYAYLLALAMGSLIGGISVASPFPFLALGVLGSTAWCSRRRQERRGAGSGGG